VRLRRIVARLFPLALVALTVAVGDAQPLHSHGQGLGGLFNADCPLAELSELSSTPAVPESAPSPSAPLGAGAAPAAGHEQPLVTPASSTASRAPPASLL